jgi:hypothetical protein
VASGVFGALGMATYIGTSAVNYLSSTARIDQNAALARQAANNALIEGQYRQQIGYRNAEAIRVKAESKVADLKRDLYRAKHSLGNYSGVSSDSGSLLDSRNAMDRQEKIDEKLILYDAEINADNSIEQGDLALWRASGSSGISLKHSYYNSYNGSVESAGSMLTDAQRLGSGLLR